MRPADLDPKIRAVVEQGGSGPRLHTLTVAQARAASRERRGRLIRTAEPVRIIRELAVPSRGGEIAGRLYAPAATALPLLVYLHGGGWALGDIESADPICRSLANRVRCSVLSLDYPLAPEHAFPEAIEAICDTIDRLARGPTAFPLMRDRIAIGGDSAGANLAAAVALQARDRGGPRLRAQLLLFPPTDAEATAGAGIDTPLLAREDMDWFWRLYLGDADRRHHYASVLNADLTGLPPALVVTAEHDVLRAEGDAYAEKLRAAGVPVDHRCYPGMIHGFLGFAAQLTAAERGLDEIGTALGALLTA